MGNPPATSAPVCGQFSYRNLTGYSAESFGFVSPATSTACISNQLQFIVCVVGIAIFLLTKVGVMSLLGHTAYKARRWTISCSMLFLADCIVGALLVLEIGHLVGLKGIGRMVTQGLPMAFLITSVTYVMLTWFRVVIAQHISGQDALNRNLSTCFFAFNACFHLVFWPLWLASGQFEEDDVRLNNLLVGASLLWVGLCELFIGGLIVYIARRMLALLREASVLTASKRIEDVSRRVFRYSTVQSTIRLIGGLAYVAIGIYGMVDASSGVRYHYYMNNFWFVPSLYLSSLLLIYVGASGRARESRREQTAVPISAVPSSLVITMVPSSMSLRCDSPLDSDSERKKSLDLRTP